MGGQGKAVADGPVAQILAKPISRQFSLSH